MRFKGHAVNLLSRKSHADTQEGAFSFDGCNCRIVVPLSIAKSVTGTVETGQGHEHDIRAHFFCRRRWFQCPKTCRHQFAVALKSAKLKMRFGNRRQTQWVASLTQGIHERSDIYLVTDWPET